MCLTFRVLFFTLSTRMNRALSYQDVYLIPQYSDVSSRSDVNCHVQFRDHLFNLPVVPANMVCTINEYKAYWMSENGYFYVMHRFINRIDPVQNREAITDMVRCMTEDHWRLASVSIGVQVEDIAMLEGWLDQGYKLDFLTVDIAHADSVRAKTAIRSIVDLRSQYNRRFFLIVGNVATPDAVERLTEWGADAVKVGIAQGGACTTYGKTGFGMPMFSCVQECAKVAKVPIIADGGIKTNGDIAKAIAAGASMVMAGSVFAACIDSPAEDVYAEQRAKIETSPAVIGERYQKWVTHKKYFGSASSTNKGNNRHVEGTTVLLPVDPMTYAEKLNEMAEDLQSACSYAGGTLEKLAVCPWGIR